MEGNTFLSDVFFLKKIKCNYQIKIIKVASTSSPPLKIPENMCTQLSVRLFDTRWFPLHTCVCRGLASKLFAMSQIMTGRILKSKHFTELRENSHLWKQTLHSEAQTLTCRNKKKTHLTLIYNCDKPPGFMWQHACLCHNVGCNLLVVGRFVTNLLSAWGEGHLSARVN